jgi:type II secretory pathway pseudopilin PulG
MRRERDRRKFTANGGTLDGAARKRITVIGIIALLISILLPALNKARAQATLISCANNLRQIAVAAIAYAGDNKDMLPPMQGDNGDYTGTTLTPFNCGGNYELSWINTWGNTPDSGALVGRLVNAKYCGNVNIEYCPAVNRAQWDLVDQAYQFNMHVCYRTFGNSTTTYMQPWWKRLSGYGKVPYGQVPVILTQQGTQENYTFPHIDHALANDNLDWLGVGSTPADPDGTKGGTVFIGLHAVGNAHSFNLVYADGHVLTVKTVGLSRATGLWCRDLDSLVALETLAANKPFNGQWNVNNVGPINPQMQTQ